MAVVTPREISDITKYYTDLHEATAYRGSTSLKKRLRNRVSPEKVDRWLRGKDYYTLFKKAKKRFPRRKTIVSGIGDTLQADLLDMRGYASVNNNVSYLLTCVDVLTRYAWVIPLTNKTGQSVADGLRKVFDANSFRHLHSDKGREFYNGNVSRLVHEYDIEHYSSEDDRIKASLVERFNQTLGSTLHRIMAHRRQKKYIDVLETVVETYNNSPHGRDSLVPATAPQLNSEDVWLNRYESSSSPSRVKPKLSVGDFVRVALYRGAFARGYDEYWTREVFKVVSIKQFENPVVYVLSDLLDERVKGTYYEDELQLIDHDPDAEFEIEKVLNTRRRRGVVEKLVKWRGYPEKFNQWIPARNIG